MTMKLTERVYESLANWGDHPVIIELMADKQPVYISAGDYRARIDEIKAFMIKSGILKNHIVALFLKNSADFAAIFLALIDIGAKPIPINLAFRKMELDEIFSNADPHAIITESDHIHVLQSYINNRILVERLDGKLSTRHSGKKNAINEPADFDEALASINYTYRGYGYPLGAMVPHSQYLMGTEILEEAVQLKKGERLLVILPMPHIFTLIGCVFLPLVYKITSVISSSRNPLRLFEHIQKYNIDNVLAVPELYELFINLRDSAQDITTLKAFLSGGSILPKENFYKLIDTFNVDLIHGYGLTEFTPVSRNIRGSIKPGTIGTVCKGLECRIMSPDAHGSGEIMIKTGNMTHAYYKRTSETRDAFDNGWFGTGDIGRIEDGYLIFEHEKKGTRKVKGNMVDLEEVKFALLQCTGIKDVLVEYNMNKLSAHIATDSNKEFSEYIIYIKKMLEQLIATYKIPATFVKL